MVPGGPPHGLLRVSISRKPCTVVSVSRACILVQSVLDELADRGRQIVFIWPVFRALQIGANWRNPKTESGPDNRALRHGF